MNSIKKYIYSQVASKSLSAKEAKSLLEEIYTYENKNYLGNNDIAIVGMACRFPGANNPEEYWEMLANKENQIKEFPYIRRKDTDSFLPDNMKSREGCYRCGGYLQDIDKFDSSHFRISPKEAEFIDPTQRLFLEVAYEAVEDAGLSGKKIYGSKTGVYVGIDTTPVIDSYSSIAMKSKENFGNTGVVTSILSSRVSYFLNLSGPSIVFDTACSSSLVALHTAYKDIINNECDSAIVGGIALFYFPTERGVLESPTDTLLAFDKGANGTVWGEGIGAVVIKSLDKAVKDRDTIYAVIKGGAVNNDGASNGLTAPNAEAQEEVIVSAWKSSGINPETISYIEAHGTGTKLGDPIEIKGLTQAFRRFTDKKQFCGIGSVKMNIGHLSGAAGISSVIKAALSLKNRKLLPCLGINEPNPYIDFTESPVYIHDKLTDWECSEYPRRCGVSSFGLSGTNCHLILEEAPELPEKRQCEYKNHIFTLSARSEERLKDLVIKYRDFLNNYENNIEDICYTVNTGRIHHNCRLVIISESLSILRDRINEISSIGLEEINGKVCDAFYAKHNIVMGKKERQEGELSEEEKLNLSIDANKKVKTFIDDDICEKMLGTIGRYYIEGADIDWDALYKKGEFNRLNLPTYSFDRSRHWVKSHTNNSTDSITTLNMRKIGKELLDGHLLNTIDESVYITEFSVDRHWILKEHRIMGTSVLPGTGYLEMVLQAAKDYLGMCAGGLRNVYFYEPLIVNDFETKKVQTIIKKQDNKNLFIVSSIKGEESSLEKGIWITHASGEIVDPADKSGNKFDISRLIERMKNEKQVLEHEMREGEVLQFGPRWSSLKSVSNNSSEALARIEIPHEFKADIEMFLLHPALMDISTSFGISQIPVKGTYLPFMYKELKVFKPIPAKCFSYITSLNNNEKSSELITYDISIIDELGDEVAFVKDFTLKRVSNIRSLAGKEDVYFKPVWRVAQDNNIDGDNFLSKKDTCMVIKDTLGIATQLIQTLRNAGNEVIEVEFGESYRMTNSNSYIISNTQTDFMSLMKDTSEKGVTRILHLATLQDELEDQTTRVPDECVYMGIKSLFYLSRSIASQKIRNKINIVLISRYASEVNGEEKCIIPQNAALFGLGKVIMQENSKLAFNCIDIDENFSHMDLFHELKCGLNKYLVAFRKGKRYIEYIEKVGSSDIIRDEMRIKENGVYIITGGTGGIGMEMGKYLAGKNKVKLILVNRSRMPERDKWNEILLENADNKLCKKIKNILEIENMGSIVKCFSADVSNLKEMESLVEDIKKEHGSIYGVIHSAGTAGDGILFQKDETVFDEVLRPKVQGTLVLDYILRREPLDIFILFSSVASIFGGIGQSDYVTANTYMDAYSLYRNKLGKKTLTINWPAWKDIGMAVDYGANQDAFFKALHTEDAVQFFDEVINSNLSRVIIGELNYSLLNETAMDCNVISLSEEIISDLKNKSKHISIDRTNKEEIQSTNVQLRGRSKGDYTDTERKLAQIWAQTLRLSEIDIYGSFYDMGGDSIFAIQLSKNMESIYPGMVDVSDIFTYPTVQQLSEYVDKKNSTIVKAVIEEQDPDADDQELRELLRNVKNKKVSVEESLEVLGKRREADNE